MPDYTQEDFRAIGEMMVMLMEYSAEVTITKYTKIGAMAEDDFQYFEFETE